MQKDHFSTTWKLRILSVVAFVLVVFLSGVESKRSACWRYGHVCWGGHGKRSGEPPIMFSPSSNEAGDGSDLPTRQWNLREVDRPSWKLYPKQSFSLPLVKPNVRQPIKLIESPNAKGHVPAYLLMQNKQLHKQMNFLLPRIQYPTMLEQNDDRMNQLPEYMNRNNLDDSLVVTSSGTSSHEIFGNPHFSAPAALKRNAIEDGLGNANVGGTEEPLETSSNGLDDGSVATFFRDRKSSGKRPVADNSEKETRYSNSHGGNKEINHVPQRLQSNNMFEILPMSQYTSGKNVFPKTTVYY